MNPKWTHVVIWPETTGHYSYTNVEYKSAPFQREKEAARFAASKKDAQVFGLSPEYDIEYNIKEKQ